MYLVRGSYWGSLGEVGGSLGEVYLSFSQTSPRHKYTISKDIVRVRGSWKLGEALFALPKLAISLSKGRIAVFQYRKSSLYTPFKESEGLVQRFNTDKGLSCLCVAFLLVRIGSGLNNRRINRRNQRNGLTAYTYSMCGNGPVWINKINQLEVLDSVNCAVSVRNEGIESPGQPYTPLEKYQKISVSSPPLQSINWGDIQRVFLILSVGRVVSYRKVGGAGGVNPC